MSRRVPGTLCTLKLDYREIAAHPLPLPHRHVVSPRPFSLSLISWPIDYSHCASHPVFTGTPYSHILSFFLSPSIGWTDRERTTKASLRYTFTVNPFPCFVPSGLIIPHPLRGPHSSFCDDLPAFRHNTPSNSLRPKDTPTTFSPPLSVHRSLFDPTNCVCVHNLCLGHAWLDLKRWWSTPNSQTFIEVFHAVLHNSYFEKLKFFLNLLT